MDTMSGFAYGPEDLQRGDLTLGPPGKPAPVVVLLHGGFWYPGYGRDLMEPLAADLAGRGYAVWNLDYRPSRRTSGWPYLFEDVAAGLDHLVALAEEHPGALDLDRVVVVGHSAGGQLALCRR
jgi:acetyl esterase/lipase